MWCPNCQADVAAEVTTDNRRVRCATCGGEVSLSSTTRTSVKTREARELLERWAHERLLSNPETHSSSPAAQRQELVTVAQGTLPSTHANDARPHVEHTTDHEAGRLPVPKSRKFRVDRAHPADDAAARDDNVAANAERRIAAVREREQSTAQKPAPPGTALDRPHGPHASFARPPAPTAGSRRIHNAHAAPTAPPHFEVQAAIGERQRPRTNWTALVGQFLAYGGVALLTVGSSLVLWGYFGGPEQYAPTGWLVTTAGQMLLFLGVVTLVSGGMEQTTEEVKHRIESLGDKILRFEQAARDNALRGPLIPAERYAHPDAVDRPAEHSAGEYAPQRTGRSTSGTRLHEQR